MTIRYAGTWFLALLALFLGLYLYFIELPAQETREAEEEKADRVLPFEPDRAVGLWLEYPRREEEREIVLERGDPDQSWQMVRPIVTEADQDAVQRLITSLSGMRQVRVVEEEVQDLGVYGLDDPEIRVLVRMQDHEEHLLLGDPAPIGSTVYVKKMGEDRIRLVGDFYRNNLLRTVADLRRKSVLGIDPAQAVRLHLKYPDRTFLLARDRGDWWLKEPRVYKADQEVVSELLFQLSSLRAKDFIDEGGSEFLEGLGSPRLLVKLEDVEVTLSTLALYQKDGETSYAVANEGPMPIYVLDAGAFSGLEVDLFRLRDKRLLVFEKEGVKTLQIETGPDTLVFEQGSDNWIFEGRPLEASREGEVRDLLEVLAQVQAVKMVEEEPSGPERYGLDPPRHRIRLLGQGQELVAALFLGDPLGDQQGAQNDGFIHARTGSSGAVYLIEGAEEVVRLIGDLGRGLAHSGLEGESQAKSTKEDRS